MEKRFEEVELKVDKMYIKMDKIYSKLVGDDLTPNGVISQIAVLDERLKKIEEFRSRVIWTLAIIGSIGGFIGFFLGLLVKLTE